MKALPELLPEAYSFDDQSAITAAEVIALRDSANWGTERGLELWQSVIDQSIATVGVRHENGLLVGVGFLAGNARHAVLCDFTVNPVHRGQGLGAAILNKRINFADNAKIPYLYTEIAPTNRLKDYYEELGFIATGHAFTRAARRHPSETTH
jgi:GNAT superfamily N-acetyltransferase